MGQIWLDLVGFCIGRKMENNNSTLNIENEKLNIIIYNTDIEIKPIFVMTKNDKTLQNLLKKLDFNFQAYFLTHLPVFRRFFRILLL